MRISDWSSDVCSSDLCGIEGPKSNIAFLERLVRHPVVVEESIDTGYLDRHLEDFIGAGDDAGPIAAAATVPLLMDEPAPRDATARSGDPSSPWGIRTEETTSELQTLIRIYYDIFCMK